jgi:hypothetical protein
MPKEFTKCVRNGGRVRTKDLGNGKYVHICYDKQGNSYPGEVLTKKKSEKKESKAASIVMSAKATLEDIQKLKEHFENR